MEYARGVATRIAGLACAGLLPFAAMAQEQAQEGPFADLVSALGKFDEPTLCAHVEKVKCDVIGSNIVMAYRLSDGVIRGSGGSLISYKPYPECAAWSLSMALEMNGQVQNDFEMTGSATGKTMVSYAMYNKATKSCASGTRWFDLDGVWNARIENDQSTGVVTFSEQQGYDAVPFTLSVMPFNDRNWDAECSRIEQDNSGLGEIIFGPKGDTGMSAACGGRG